MAQYPSNIPDWTDPEPLVNQTHINYAEHVNELRDEVKAVAQELGTNPRGAASSVKQRLLDVENTKAATSHSHSGFVASTLVDAKGDLIVATADNAVARLGKGTNGQALVADSAQATGLKYKNLDHNTDLTNLTSGDPHTQYLNSTRHDALHPEGVGYQPFTGMITPMARTAIPSEWLECNGAAVSRSTYASLFAVIGTTFGSGDGSTTFNVPDLRGRTPFGFTSADTDFDTVGKTGGAKTVALTTGELPAHDHSSAGSHSHGGSSGSGGGSHSHSGTTGSHSHSHTASSAGSHTHSYSTPSYAYTTFSGANSDVNVPQTSGTTGSSGSHTHGTDSQSHTHSFTTGSSSDSHSHSVSVGSGGTHTHSSVGSGTAHANMPPNLVLKFVIYAGV